MNSLFSMGGYGVYVWTTYGITFAVFGINLITSLLEKRHIKKMIRSNER